jgi:HEAT repeat protein
VTARPPYSLTPAEQQRIERIDQLLVLGGASVPELLAAAGDASWTVRRAAVAALAALGDEAVPRLWAWLVAERSSERAIAAVVDALVGSVGSTVNAAAIERLAHPKPPVAADAAAILGRRHAQEALAPLVATLAHADDNVAVATIEALGALGPAGVPAGAIEPLIAVVDSRSFFRAFPAVQVLARSGDPRAIKPIAALLDDPMFRDEAIRALGRTGSVLAIHPLCALLPGADTGESRVIATALADLVTRSEWSGAGAHVVQGLRTALAPSLGALAAALAGADTGERAALIRLLGRAGDAEVLPVLVALLGDPEVRDLAADAVKALGRGHDVALLATLGDADPATLAAVVPLVSSLRDAAAVRALLDDSDAELRARACEALARLGDTGAVPELFEALADVNPRVGLAAAGAIQSLHSAETGPRALAALATGTPAVRRQVLRIIAYLGLPDAFTAVHAATEDPDPRIAELAVGALAAIPDPRVDPVLAELARAAAPGLRAAVMRALAQRGAEGSAAQLSAGLADDDAWVRYYAAQGLGRLAHGDATPALLQRLADPAPFVRIAAIEALARLATPAAWVALTSAVRSQDPDERRAALVGLGQHARPAALPILVAAARDGDLATRLIALSGLAVQSGEEATRELAIAARDPDLALRDTALSLLGERDEPAAIDALVEIAFESELDHPVHRTLSRPSPARIAALADHLARAGDRDGSVIAAALARMADARATAALFDALGTGSPAVRRAVATSLSAMGAAGASATVARLAAEDPDPDVRRISAALADGK